MFKIKPKQYKKTVFAGNNKRIGCQFQCRQIRRRYQNYQGFSIIGLTISTFIITMGLLSFFALSNVSLQSSVNSRMRLIASGLAQEGIEIIRDIRMSNSNWNDWEWYGAAHPISDTESYCIQYDSTALTTCPASRDPLKINKTSLLYQYDSGEDTPFYREATLTRLSDEEVKVILEIKWQVRGSDDWYYLIAEDRLWNWK